MKIYSGICVGSVLLGMASMVQAGVMPVSSAVLVCRAQQCASADYSMTRSFLFNKMNQMISTNTDKKASLCEADPISHVCLRDGIRIPAQAAFAETDIIIPSVSIVDTKLVRGSTQMDIVLDFQVAANQTVPRCSAVVSRLNVAYVDKVEWMVPDFTCQITETGQTSLNASFNIDYIDFDYGYIGGYYTFGVGESVRGDDIGYVLMRFTEKHTEPPKEPIIIDEIVVNQQIITPKVIVTKKVKESAEESETQKTDSVKTSSSTDVKEEKTVVVTSQEIKAPIQSGSIEVTPIPQEPEKVPSPFSNAKKIFNDILYLETPDND